MARDVRDRMIDGAVKLLALKGLDGTSFSTVLELTGAPRGSVYHHFPAGKNQLVASAVDLAGVRALDSLDLVERKSAQEIANFFLGMWRGLLEQTQFRAGCSVLAVTVATDSPDLLRHAADVFRTWRVRLAQLLEAGGMPAEESRSYAALLVAASEGAVVLSRAEQAMEPFDLVAAQLLSRFG